MKTKYIKETLELIVKDSISMRQTLNKLGLTYSGGNYSHIKKIILLYNINTSHFLGQGSTAGVPPKGKLTKEEFIERVLKKGGSCITGTRLKKHLIKFGFKKDRCELCGLTGLWNNKKLSFQIDHINGDRNDNEISNLRIVCPNCHSQTETFSGKKNKKFYSHQP